MVQILLSVQHFFIVSILIYYLHLLSIQGMTHLYDVAIIGAGVTGITLANSLSRHAKNLDFIVLEKDVRLGGRLKSEKINPKTGHIDKNNAQNNTYIMEHGAAWIHGPKKHPAMKYLKNEFQQVHEANIWANPARFDLNADLQVFREERISNHLKVHVPSRIVKTSQQIVETYLILYKDAIQAWRKYCQVSPEKANDMKLTELKNAHSDFLNQGEVHEFLGFSEKLGDGYAENDKIEILRGLDWCYNLVAVYFGDSNLDYYRMGNVYSEREDSDWALIGDCEGAHGKVKGGWEQIIEKLMEECGDDIRNRVKINCEVKSVTKVAKKPMAEEHVKIKYSNDTDITAKIVINTVPVKLWKEIEFKNFSAEKTSSMEKLEQKVVNVKMKKIWLGFDKPWWDTSKKLIACLSKGEGKRSGLIENPANDFERSISQAGLGYIENHVVTQGENVLLTAVVDEDCDLCGRLSDDEIGTGIAKCFESVMREKGSKLVWTRCSKWLEGGEGLERNELNRVITAYAEF